MEPSKSGRIRRLHPALLRTGLLFTIGAVLLGTFSGATFAKYAVTIEDEGVQRLVYTSYEEPKAILAAEKIPLGVYDEVTLTSVDENESLLTIHRASEVMIYADGKQRRVSLADGTVADALAKAEITLGEEDLIDEALDTSLEDGMEITINRITHEEVDTQEAIPAGVTEIPTPTLKKGRTRTLSSGKEGVRQITATRTLLDGEIIEEEVLYSEVLAEPVPAEVLVGDPNAEVSQLTPSAPLELDADGNPVQYRTKLTGKATAYSSRSYRTKLKPGHVAMDLSQFPKGTQLYIKTPDGSFVYGYSVVKDTGAAVIDGTCLVDLFFDSYTESCLFGAKEVEIYVL